MNKKLTTKKISTKKLNKIYGGLTWRNTKGPTTTNEYGCVTTRSDVYGDANDDGKMNEDDWKSLSACEGTTCP